MSVYHSAAANIRLNGRRFIAISRQSDVKLDTKSAPKVGPRGRNQMCKLGSPHGHLKSYENGLNEAATFSGGGGGQGKWMSKGCSGTMSGSRFHQVKGCHTDSSGKKRGHQMCQELRMRTTLTRVGSKWQLECCTNWTNSNFHILSNQISSLSSPYLAKYESLKLSSNCTQISTNQIETWRVRVASPLTQPRRRPCRLSSGRAVVRKSPPPLCLRTKEEEETYFGSRPSLKKKVAGFIIDASRSL